MYKYIRKISYFEYEPKKKLLTVVDNLSAKNIFYTIIIFQKHALGFKKIWFVLYLNLGELPKNIKKNSRIKRI